MSAPAVWSVHSQLEQQDILPFPQSENGHLSFMAGHP
jgi:hypothetical protein